MKVYKIRDKETWLYLQNCSNYELDSDGYNYSSSLEVADRLRTYESWRSYWFMTWNTPKRTWEVVEYELVELRAIPAEEFTGDKQ